MSESSGSATTRSYSATTVEGVTPLGRNDPERIGPYRILGVLGEGGMGIVYLAEQQDPVRRKVALKVNKLETGSGEFLARFEVERQALARFAHSGIAKIYDAGTAADGRAYFAMEYVAGLPITTFCDRHTMDLRQRIALFVPVCEAAHHAHLNAVIHRDLTPQNILVSAEGESPVPKIIDFGIAKSLDEPLTERTYYTRQSVILGKPAYMPPEQAGLSPSQVNATADIYSLGVVLYELVVGALPFDHAMYRRASDAGYEALINLIRHGNPLRPSERIKGLRSEAAGSASSRGTTVTGLTRALRNEIDWICMRAIDKDPARRYAAASELAADLRRYLAGEPVLAGPPTTWYRLRRSVRRHRVALAISASIVVTLLAGILATTTMYFHAEAARRDALRQGYLANLRAAIASLGYDEVTEARRALGACDPSIRGWEWRHLWAESDQSVARLDTQGGRVWARFSPDGRRIAAGCGNGEVQIWDVRLRARIATLRGPRGSVNCVAWSPNGTKIAAGTSDSLLCVWNATQEQPLFKHRRLGGNVNTVAWSRGGDSIAVGGGEPFVELVNSGNGVPVGRLELNGGDVNHVEFAPDGHRIAVAQADGTTRVLDLRTGGVIHALGAYPEGANYVRFDRAGRVVGTSGVHSTIRLWDAGTGRLLREIGGHEVYANGIAFSPDGRQLASTSSDKTMRVWDVATGRLLAKLVGHEGYGYGVDFDPSGRFVASGSDDGTVRLWDVSPDAPATSLVTGAPISGVATIPGGDEVVSVGQDSSLRVWDSDSGRLLLRLRSPTGALASVAVTPDASLLVAGEATGVVRIWRRDGTLFRSWQAHRAPVTAIAVDARGRWIITASPDSTARIWSLDEGRLGRLLGPFPHLLTDACFGPDGALFVTGWQHGLSRWSWDGKVAVERFRTGGNANAAAPSADAGKVYVITWEGRLLECDSRTGTLQRELGGHHGVGLGVTLSPDGSRAATVGEDGALRVWDLARGEQLVALPGHSGDLTCVAWSRDGATLVTGASDGTLRFWRSAPANGGREPARETVPQTAASSVENRSAALWVERSYGASLQRGVGIAPAVRRVYPQR